MSTRIAADQVRLKRAYEAAESSDGLRVLVDRLWPRGVTREDAALDLWLKELAPSTGLRKWFGHDPARWPEFQRRYGEEVLEHPEAFEQLCDLARTQRVTLVFSAKDEDHNDAVVLRSLLLGAGKAE
jgi:uncharacterized protein YeaO (DUF488 family)